MELNDKIVTAIIAGVVSLIGALISIYLNKKSNKQLIQKIKLEYELDQNTEQKRKLEHFLYEVKKFQFVLEGLINEILNRDPDWENIEKLFRDHSLIIREEWSRVTFQIHVEEMKAPLHLGAYIHDGIGGALATILLLFRKIIDSSDGRNENVEIVLSEIRNYHKQLDDLIKLIITGIKEYENNIFTL